jgi:hypothetical protein
MELTFRFSPWLPLTPNNQLTLDADHVYTYPGTGVTAAENEVSPVFRHVGMGVENMGVVGCPPITLVTQVVCTAKGMLPSQGFALPKQQVMVYGASKGLGACNVMELLSADV